MRHKFRCCIPMHHCFDCIVCIMSGGPPARWRAHGLVEKRCCCPFGRWQGRHCVIQERHLYIEKKRNNMFRWYNLAKTDVQMRLLRYKLNQLFELCVFQLTAENKKLTFRVRGHLEVLYWMQHLLDGVRTQPTAPLSIEQPSEREESSSISEACEQSESEEVEPQKPPKLPQKTSACAETVRLMKSKSDSRIVSAVPKLSRVNRSLSEPGEKKAWLPVRPTAKDPKSSISVPKVNSFLTELKLAVNQHRQRVQQLAENAQTPQDDQSEMTNQDDQSEPSTTEEQSETVEESEPEAVPYLNSPPKCVSMLKSPAFSKEWSLVDAQHIECKLCRATEQETQTFEF